ncbi:MAG TPA: hypothetical protein DCE80_03815 [Ignavibacteriales bacterium]|nr:hypothetical protein [Ignavibacteriales bacterium]
MVNKEKRSPVFSLSVNIIRDADSELNYIPTPNSKQVFNQLINDYKAGTRSFNIIGSYGTGKSSFLWALEKNISQKHNYFAPLNGAFNGFKGFEFFALLGEFRSIIETFAKQLGLVDKRDFSVVDVIQQLDKYYKSLYNAGKGLVIVIDEFGKFLEYAAKNNPENELYFIQQLAEYVNDQRKNIFFITTLHQDFNGYSRNLTKTQQNEWDKVKGRLKEITFNEPVEQLLFLASERLSKLRLGVRDKNFSRLFKSIEDAKVFPLKDYFSKSYAEKLLPFDMLSAAVLTLALQKYGQNERSLFSFIESNDHLGIKDINQKATYYNLNCVYDYLIHNYYSFLTTKYNPHYTQWAAIRTAIERVEGVFKENITDAVKLVKTIGLLNIFASASARLDKEFLCEYGNYSLGIKEPEKIIKALDGFKIIRFVKHKNKYILFEGTDLDIELAIYKAANLIERVANVVHHLNHFFNFPYISAKLVSYEKGTPRFFAFCLSETPVKLKPEGEIDGFINLIFSDAIKERDIKEASEKCKEAVLYGWYKNTFEIKNLFFEIEKIKKVKESHHDDKIAVCELEGILQHQIKLLNHYVQENIYSEDSPVIWYFHGKREHITDRKSFNRLLSKICIEVYPDTPPYRNEMVNKTRLSSPIATARKNFVRALVASWNKRDLGFEAGKFPPEKTIYLSLLRETGIHKETPEGFILAEPADKSYLPLWNTGIDFLQRTRQGKRNLKELVDALLSKPFKLKQGFIDFWLPVFLFIKRDDFALFSNKGYIPYITEDTLDLVSKNPKDYEIKAFDIEGVKLNLFNQYRTLLNQSQQQKTTGKSFIETIRPFLTFYKQLPEYAKTTKRLNKKSIALREAIAYSKDPEETFFEHFPKALGYNIVQLQKSQEQLEAYIQQLQTSIREIRTCYNELVNRLEAFLLEEIIGEKLSFPDYKAAFQSRFRKLKNHLLLPHQKVFYQRMMSELDDHKAWLSSISQACIGKSLDLISDEEEKVLYEKLKDIIHELDNLCELSKADVDKEKEDVFKLEITSFVEGIKKTLIRLPKNRNKEIIQWESVVKAKLSSDRRINIAVLLKLLQDQLEDGK